MNWPGGRNTLSVARTSFVHGRPDDGDAQRHNEIIFNPFRRSPTHGPSTKLFRRSLWSDLPPHTTWSVLAYLTSYYAISVAWWSSPVNFALVGVLAEPDCNPTGDADRCLALEDTSYETDERERTDMLTWIRHHELAGPFRLPHHLCRTQQSLDVDPSLSSEAPRRGSTRDRAIQADA